MYIFRGEKIRSFNRNPPSSSTRLVPVMNVQHVMDDVGVAELADDIVRVGGGFPLAVLFD